ncbi:MAG: BTAD domain-containing putative transcriptional regulator [Caldilineaceae bacterium]
MLKLTLLGAPQLFLNGQRMSQQITGKHLALLVYLAVTGRPHRRDALAALLWRDLSNGQARKQLSNVLSDLRKQIDPYLVIKPQEVYFDTTANHWVDVIAFQRYTTTEQVKNNPSLLQETLALYRGEFLAGFVVRDAPAFEEWVLQKREELHTLVTEGLLRQTEYALAQRDYTTGIAASNRWLTLEPESELAHRQKMRLLAANGQRSAALAQYERCHQILDEEFGVAPSAETNALYLQIKADEYQQKHQGQSDQQAELVSAAIPTTPPVVPTLTLPHNLSMPLSPFCGRQEELAFIEETLLQSACRFLTITGMGGVGKTRLAQEAARRLATTLAGATLFGDGVFFIALDETATDEAEEKNSCFLYHKLSTILTLSVSTSEPLLPQIKAHLASQKMLLVVDNLEHRLDQTALIADLPKRRHK